MILVTAAILIKDNSVLIAKRKSSDSLPNKWEFPGGKIEDNETAEQCLIRELKEEFGINIKITSYFGDSIYQYPEFKIKLIAFHCKWLDGQIVSSAHDEYKWVRIEKLDKYDFADADIPLVKKLMKEYQNGF
jgi:8-oxo-dGTP diphosphatase